MVYTIVQISDLIGLSKVSIYKKLKLKGLKDHISKKLGVTYVDEVGFNLIKYGLKENLKEQSSYSTLNYETATDTEDLSFNKEVLKLLEEQLKGQNLIIHELNERLKQEQELNKNNQILQLRLPQETKQLEEHFDLVDEKLMNISRWMLKNHKKDF